MSGVAGVQTPSQAELRPWSYLAPKPLPTPPRSWAGVEKAVAEHQMWNQKALIPAQPLTLQVSRVSCPHRPTGPAPSPPRAAARGQGEERGNSLQGGSPGGAWEGWFPYLGGRETLEKVPWSREQGSEMDGWLPPGLLPPSPPHARPV